eukprot:433851-Prorocentrum_minimum.AAC.1
MGKPPGYAPPTGQRNIHKGGAPQVDTQTVGEGILVVPMEKNSSTTNAKDIVGGGRVFLHGDNQDTFPNSSSRARPRVPRVPGAAGGQGL